PLPCYTLKFYQDLSIFGKADEFSTVSFIILTFSRFRRLDQSIKTRILLILGMSQQHSQLRHGIDKSEVFARLCESYDLRQYHMLLNSATVRIWLFVTEFDRCEFPAVVMCNRLFIDLIFQWVD